MTMNLRWSQYIVECVHCRYETVLSRNLYNCDICDGYVWRRRLMADVVYLIWSNYIAYKNACSKEEYISMIQKESKRKGISFDQHLKELEDEYVMSYIIKKDYQKEEQELKTESERLCQVLRPNPDFLFLEVIKKFMLS